MRKEKGGKRKGTERSRNGRTITNSPHLNGILGQDSHIVIAGEGWVLVVGVLYLHGEDGCAALGRGCLVLGNDTV